LKATTDDPSQLTRDDVGKLYHIPLDTTKALNFDAILPSKLKRQVDTFEECALLCRQEFLEVVHCLQAARTSFPAIRVVLWGKFGTGKTTTLAQSVHYAYTQNWTIVNVRDLMDWTRKVNEVQMSTYKQGRIDLPIYAVNFLQHFKHQNQHVWEKLTELKTQKTYEFTKTEKTLEDKPITELVEMGIASPLFASDCVGALFKELRRYSTKGDIKLLVAFDGANSMYGKTLIRKADKSWAKPSEVSLIHHMKKFLKDDWSNGIVLMIADKREISNARDPLSVPRDTPLELFGEEGFEDIDPFIPIETQLYNEKEAGAIHGYYKDKNWITNEEAKSEAGLKELYYLSAFNPYYFERLCAFN